MPDNIKTLQVFNNDQQIPSFMSNKRVFSSQDIGEEQAQANEGHQKEEEDEFIFAIENKQTS